MTTVPPPQFKVPRLLWESMEAVLQAQGKKYVREIAKTLEVDPRELIRQVFNKDTVPVILHDTTTTTLECSAYIQERGAAKQTMARLCRRPVQLGSEFCSHHILCRPTVVTEEATVTVRRLQDDPTRPTLWVHEDGRAVDVAGKTAGFYDTETGSLTLFEVGTASEEGEGEEEEGEDEKGEEGKAAAGAGAGASAEA
jgi:hypothetical protein